MNAIRVELVVDTSALLAVLLDEPERAALLARTQGATLLAPGSVPWEVGDALIAGFRRRRLTPQEVRDAWASFERIPLRLLPVAVGNALALAEDLGLYAYDAYILETVRATRRPLLATDKRLQAAAVRLGLRIWEAAQ
jgi:predicted nucleic acid-binding protein